MNDIKRKYISLKEASESCTYSQEYLSLRARQGKLKAVKFGRNWVTTKEWLDEYLAISAEDNNHQNSDQKVFNPPSNLPVKENLLRFDFKKEFQKFNAPDFDFSNILVGFNNLKNSLLSELKIEKVKEIGFTYIALFILSFFVTNIVFGQTSIKNVYSQYTDFTRETSEKFDEEVIVLADVRIPELFGSTLSSIKNTENKIYNNLAILINAYKDTGDLFVTTEKQIYNGLLNKGISTNNFFETLANSYTISDKLTDQAISRGSVGVKDYFVNLISKTINDYIVFDKLADKFFVERLSDAGNYIKNIVNNGVQLYVDADRNLDKKIFGLGRKMYVGWQFVIGPWQDDKKIFLGSSQEIQDIKNEITKIKEEGFPVKEIEVSRITRIEPIKEITKEIITVSDDNLALMEARVNSLEEDIINRLYAPNGVVSQTIYVTQPVASPKFYQENGDIVLQTVGSGSVIISAATGAQISGQQIMIDSTDPSNPLVLINDPTEVRGPIVINPPSYYTGKIFDVQLAGDSLVSIDHTGSLTIGGTTTFLGPLIVNVDSTTPALSITQSGTGDLISLTRTGGGSFVINENGFIVGTGTLKINEPGGETWEMGVTPGKLNYSDALTIASGGTGDIILDSASGKIVAATGDTFYTEGGNPIRAAGEEMFKEAVVIFRYSMPSQTSSNSFIRISKHFDNTSDISLPSALTGTTRKYRLIINYSDNIDPADLNVNSRHSDWRIVNAAGDVVSSTFELVGQNLSELEEGKPYLTEQLIIPDTDWQVELKVPTGKTVRIHQIYLVAYDEIN
jgi:hypothetical protein